MGIDVDGLLEAAEDKIAVIDNSSQDLGIHKRLLLTNFLQEWSWMKDDDTEPEEPASRKRSSPSPSPKAKKRRVQKEAASSLNPHRRTRRAERSKAKLESRARRRRCPAEAVPSDTRCVREVQPVHPVACPLPILYEGEPCNTDEWDWLFVDVYDLPTDAPVPDPDLSFLEQH
ncbi:uncharacterized protein [Dermacentor albipictus]|uniref:uncharacterized protein n=1 Tax=Dermacentor albipictus TaxID=60249 RepID=UPI0031FCE2DE